MELLWKYSIVNKLFQMGTLRVCHQILEIVDVSILSKDSCLQERIQVTKTVYIPLHPRLCHYHTIPMIFEI